MTLVNFINNFLDSLFNLHELCINYNGTTIVCLDVGLFTGTILIILMLSLIVFGGFILLKVLFERITK